jgi:hypothetical protein
MDKIFRTAKLPDILKPRRTPWPTCRMRLERAKLPNAAIKAKHLQTVPRSHVLLLTSPTRSLVRPSVNRPPAKPPTAIWNPCRRGDPARGCLRTFEKRVPVVLRPWRYPANHGDCPNAPCESVSSLNLARHVGGFSFSVRRLFGIRAVKPDLPDRGLAMCRPPNRQMRASEPIRLASGRRRRPRWQARARDAFHGHSVANLASNRFSALAAVHGVK